MKNYCHLFSSHISKLLIPSIFIVWLRFFFFVSLLRIHFFLSSSSATITDTKACVCFTNLHTKYDPVINYKHYLTFSSHDMRNLPSPMSLPLVLFQSSNTYSKGKQLKWIYIQIYVHTYMSRCIINGTYNRSFFFLVFVFLTEIK